MGVRETLSIGRARRCLVLLYLFIRLTLLSWSNETLIQGTLIFPEWILFSVVPLAFLLLMSVFVPTWPLV